MEVIKIRQSQLNTWRKMLYNQETLPPVIQLMPEDFPRNRIKVRSPLELFASEPIACHPSIFFKRTRGGWRPEMKIELVLDIPCPLLPKMMQEDIREGYKTIQECENAVVVTAKDVMVAAWNRLNRN